MTCLRIQALVAASKSQQSTPRESIERLARGSERDEQDLYLWRRPGLPPVAVTATAVDSTATPRQWAVEQRPVAWVREVLTGRYGQRHGRYAHGLRILCFEAFYAQK
ncbi:hypothetical protein C8J57DRAFT_1482482 [Mycena rebaudengoi]|nr:hypothetical protein C8J57DRAFT_1482482 [Mycena rebaudengoi]